MITMSSQRRMRGTAATGKAAPVTVEASMPGEEGRELAGGRGHRCPPS